MGRGGRWSGPQEGGTHGSETAVRWEWLFQQVRAPAIVVLWWDAESAVYYAAPVSILRYCDSATRLLGGLPRGVGAIVRVLPRAPVASLRALATGVLISLTTLTAIYDTGPLISGQIYSASIG